MHTQTEDPARAALRIHPDTLPGFVHLTVANLEQQIQFYQSMIGLQLHWREGATVAMGAGGADLLLMTEAPAARRYRRVTGMYHFALLLPGRRELALVIARLLTLRYPNSPTDHIMTKTTYLDDPEGNNIEIYIETPEDGFFGFADGEFIARNADGTPGDGRALVDLEQLFTALQEGDRLDAPMPPATRIGHFHLYIADLAAAYNFYHNVLGFDDMGLSPEMGAGFVAAGGYHHHIGFNTWVGAGAPPPPADALGLRYITFTLPDADAVAEVVESARVAGVPVAETELGWQVRDPSKNALVLMDGTVTQANRARFNSLTP